MFHLVRRDPRQCGLPQTRWTLAALRDCLAHWRVASRAGLSRLLRRLGVRLRRARTYVHSPDPHYQAKRAYLAQVQLRVAAHYPREVLLYLDECTYWQQPTLAQTYAPLAEDAPRAHWGHNPNRERRLLATLDAQSGQVCYAHASHIRVTTLRAFYQALLAAYPQTERFYVVQDNWPVHFHPDVRVCLEPQSCPFEFPQPPSWTQAPKRAGLGTPLPIQLVPLPTYASWCNPIEKLWRKLRQDLLHLHRLATRWHDLQAHVESFLNQFAAGSLDLLRYVGLA